MLNDFTAETAELMKDFKVHSNIFAISLANPTQDDFAAGEGGVDLEFVCGGNITLLSKGIIEMMLDRIDVAAVVLQAAVGYAEQARIVIAGITVGPSNGKAAN